MTSSEELISLALLTLTTEALAQPEIDAGGSQHYDGISFLTAFSIPAAIFTLMFITICKCCTGEEAKQCLIDTATNNLWKKHTTEALLEKYETKGKGPATGDNAPPQSYVT